MKGAKASLAKDGRKNYVSRRESIFARGLTSPPGQLFRIKKSFPSFDIPTVKPYDHCERTVIVSLTLADLGITSSRKIAADTLYSLALTSSIQVFPGSGIIRTPPGKLLTLSSSTYASKADLTPHSTQAMV